MSAHSAFAQVPVPPMADRQVEIILRDTSGLALEGATIDLVRSDGGFTQTYQTDADGKIMTFVRPGSYLVQFTGSWNGQVFVPIEQQNAGAVPQNYDEAGGLGVFIEPSAEIARLRFVIAKSEDNQLVPLYDLAVTEQETPQPYLFDGSSVPAIGILPTRQRAEIILEPVAVEATFSAAAAAANERTNTLDNSSIEARLNRPASVFSLQLDIDWFELIISVLILLIFGVLIATIVVILLARQLSVSSKEAVEKS